jgi:hypothetical protein
VTVTPEIWEGDSLPESDEDVMDIFDELGMLPSEVRAIADACKTEAWVHEKLAKHLRDSDPEESEDNLVISRHFWRRTERLNALAKAYDERCEENNE